MVLKTVKMHKLYTFILYIYFCHVIVLLQISIFYNILLLVKYILSLFLYYVTRCHIRCVFCIFREMKTTL